MLGAQSTTPLRGDYAHVAADFTIDQDMAAYTPTDRETWTTLIRGQRELVRRHAARPFLDGLEKLALDEEVPVLRKVSARIADRTGWRLVTVPGFIPDRVFFAHLAERRFPISVWVRQSHEIDFLVEPDLFHDLFGHAPLLMDPVFADYLQRYGAAGKAAEETALPRLARLYWYMVEFGLLGGSEGLKAYGAGLLSSKAETVYAVTDPRPHRVWFEAERVMRTRYQIDRFQRTYFVVPDFSSLFAALDGEIAARLAAIGDLSDIDPERTLAADRLFQLT